MSYTSFGKYLRKLMIDRDENLQDLAKLFGVSIPFISSVLMGKKNIPQKWIDIIAEEYSLDEFQREELINVYEESKLAIKIDLSNYNSEQRNIAIHFQRNLGSLTEDEIKKIGEILGEKK